MCKTVPHTAAHIWGMVIDGLADVWDVLVITMLVVLSVDVRTDLIMELSDAVIKVPTVLIVSVGVDISAGAEIAVVGDTVLVRYTDEDVLTDL